MKSNPDEVSDECGMGPMCDECWDVLVNMKAMAVAVPSRTGMDSRVKHNRGDLRIGAKFSDNRKYMRMSWRLGVVVTNFVAGGG